MPVITDIKKFEFIPLLTGKQTLAWDAMRRPDIKEILYGGAKGGGKSVFGCMWSFHKALEIIKKCDKYFEHILVHTGQNYDYTLNLSHFQPSKQNKPVIQYNS